MRWNQIDIAIGLAKSTIQTPVEMKFLTITIKNQSGKLKSRSDGIKTSYEVEMKFQTITLIENENGKGKTEVPRPSLLLLPSADDSSS
ncbi:unnamed protein product [Linum trigynum]|uniref:Uncharacterized protein n=1 Tax=Linum trigynum TaxID=586398 RepID=A0AAV2DM77_9ROSI